MTPEALAKMQARAMPGPPRPWSPAEFAQFLAAPNVRLFSNPNAALIARRAGAEAEVLTLFTDPSARRRGLASALLTQMEGWATDQGIGEAFLEVAETNAPARALYARAGYTPRGYRKDYYATPGGPRVHALVLAKPLMARP